MDVSLIKGLIIRSLLFNQERGKSGNVFNSCLACERNMVCINLGGLWGYGVPLTGGFQRLSRPTSAGHNVHRQMYESPQTDEKQPLWSYLLR